MITTSLIMAAIMFTTLLPNVYDGLGLWCEDFIFVESTEGWRE